MARVLVVGSAVLDFVYAVDRLPQTAQKYQALGMQIVGGGCAANAAVAITRLGGEAQLVARFGRDEVLDLVVQDLKAERVDLSLIDVAQEGRSAVSSIYIDGAGERQIMAFRGEGLAQSPSPLDIRTDAVLADTRWPEATRAAFAATDGLKVLDGEAPVPEDIAMMASHVVFSEQGLLDFDGGTDVIGALDRCTAKLPGWVAVTRGAEGVAWEGRTMPGFAVDVKDTLGAGDVWHGAFTLMLAEGGDELTATRFANAAAAIKCQGFGGRKAAPTRAQLEQFLKDRP